MAQISENADDPLADAEAAGEIGTEKPEADTVEQRTSAGSQDDETPDDAWARVPDEVDPADATEQRRVAGPLDGDDYRES